jgi:hypothetical protein
MRADRLLVLADEPARGARHVAAAAPVDEHGFAEH